jgi:hypothetical protein
MREEVVLGCALTEGGDLGSPAREEVLSERALL